MGGSRSRPSRPVELEESPTSRSFTRQVPFNDEEPASPSSPPWTPLGPVSPGTGSLSLGGRQFFGRSSGPSSPEPSPLSPKSQSSKSSRPFLARSWSALSLGGKKDEPQELTEFLRQVPLLKCLPRAKVSLLTEVASVQKFAPGSDVVRQGEEGSSFFIIRSGSAVVVKENEEDEEEEEEELLVLKKGDFFGERSLLTDELRSATVRADTQLVVLEVTREQFDRLGLREELDFHGRKSLLVTHLVNAQTPAEKTREDLKFIRDSVARNENLSNILDVRQMPHFADPAWKEEVQVGQNVIEEGDVNADFFYVVRSGEFQILIDGSVTGTLGRGDCFGELSLICSAPRTATVRATAISTLWVLPRGWLKSAAEESARLASKLSMVYLNQVRTLDVLLQAEKEMLAPLLAKVVFKKNDSILRFGEEETSMYILAEGTVRVEDDKVVELEAYLTENQQHLVVHTFGERALIGDGFNSDMSVKISSPEATCYRLDGVDFISMLGSIEEILQQSRRGLDFQGLDTDAPMNTSRLVQFRKKDLQRVSFLRAGQFGNLELWCHTLTGVQYMVKAVSKGYIMEQGLQKKIIQERDIMMMLDSSFTISLFQTFTGEQMLYFLMETALGGDLYTAYLKNALHGSQRHAVFYSALVVLALEHLHGKKVAYRDLKPENVLLSSTGYVKLVDFSLAKVVIGRTYTIVGTPEYLAPEMIGVSGHNQAVDWWALGIFIFELLSGQTPFEGSNPMQTFGKTMAGVEKVTFSSKVSSGARRLIEGLLKRSPAFRLAMKKGGVQNVKDADWYGDVDWRKLQMQAEDAPLKGLSMETANFHSHEQRKAPFVPFEDDGSGWAEAFASWNMKSENVEF